MATATTGVSLSATGIISNAVMLKQAALYPPQLSLISWTPQAGQKAGRAVRLRVAASGPATPSEISKKLSESIKNAEEACSGNSESRECAAAWDEVEEVSAAASHARDKLKGSYDPLENFCKDNPETVECRTYDN